MSPPELLGILGLNENPFGHGDFVPTIFLLFSSSMNELFLHWLCLLGSVSAASTLYILYSSRSP